MIAILLAACTPQNPVAVEGVVFDGPGATSLPLGDVDIDVVDLDGNKLGDARADADGRFEFLVEEPGTVFLVLRKDGYVTTSIPGVIGAAENQEIETHAVYLVSEAGASADDQRFDGCAGVGDAGGIVGEVRVSGLIDPITGLSPLSESSKVKVYPVDGVDRTDEAIPACYLTDDGAVWDPEGFWTGAAGTFGIFGLAPGRYQLEVRIEFSAQLFDTVSYPVFIPDDSRARSPWYPAWIELPN